MQQYMRRLLQPLIQTLTRLQLMMTCYRRGKLILYLLNLMLVVQLYTGLQLKGRAMVAAIVALYLLVLKAMDLVSTWKSLMTYLAFKSSYREKVFLAIAAIFMLDLKNMSMFIGLISIFCCAIQIQQTCGRNLGEGEYGFAILESILTFVIVINVELIALQYDGYINVGWKIVLYFLLMCLFIPTIIAVIKLAANTISGAATWKSQDWLLFAAISIAHLCISSLILEYYVSAKSYQVILLISFSLSSLEMLIYVFCFGYLLIKLGLQKTGFRIFVRLRSGQIRGIQESGSRDYLKCGIFSEQKCNFCENKAKILHQGCGHLIACYECFIVNILHDSQKCSECNKKGPFYVVWDSQDLKDNGEAAIIMKYLSPGHYIALDQLHGLWLSNVIPYQGKQFRRPFFDFMKLKLFHNRVFGFLRWLIQFAWDEAEKINMRMADCFKDLQQITLDNPALFCQGHKTDMSATRSFDREPY